MWSAMTGYVTSTRASGIVPLPGRETVVSRVNGHSARIKVDEVRLSTTMRVVAGVTGGEGVNGVQVLRPSLEVRGGSRVRT